MTLTERVKRKALDLGFQAVGVSRVTSDRPEAARLTEWLSQGYHGEMGWMARTAKKRQNPALLLPGIRAIVSIGMNYDTEDQPDDRPGHGRIARYARGEDYHRVLGERLKALAAFLQTEAPDSRNRAYVDTGAVMEKAWAQRAGLGWIGKHSNLVSAQHGSWLLLGEVLTTAALNPDEPGADLCGTCTLCIRACPTGAITEPYVVDARRCLSYLTIEQKGHIPKEFQRALEFFRDVPLLLDRQVGQAAARVHDVGLGDGAGRTGADAQRASPAQVGAGLIGIEGRRRQHLPQQQPGAMLSGDEV